MLRKEKIQIDELVIEVHDERVDIDDKINNIFNQKILQQALSKLPERSRELIILKYVNDLSNKEISEVLDKSESAIRTALSRSLTKLKELLNDNEF